MSTEITEIYILKRIKDRADAAVKERRAELMADLDPEGGVLQAAGLQVKFAPMRGRKEFDAKLAESYLRENMDPKEFASRFEDFRITRLPGTVPPPELLAEMQKYFKIDKVTSVTEAGMKGSSIPPDDLDENCYRRSSGGMRMTTPTEIADRDLLDLARQQHLDVVSKLLLGESSGQ